MERDMDLVRRILAELESSRNPIDAADLADGNHARDEVAYHIRIMAEAGLIHAKVIAADNDPNYFVRADELTWEGQEFLANVRSDTVWSKVKLSIAKSVGHAGFEAYKIAAAQVIASSLVL